MGYDSFCPEGFAQAVGMPETCITNVVSYWKQHLSNQQAKLSDLEPVIFKIALIYIYIYDIDKNPNPTSLICSKKNIGTFPKPPKVLTGRIWVLAVNFLTVY